MSAVQYNGSRRLDVVPTEPTPPRAGEVRIAVAYTGICGTDLHVFHGDMDARVSMPAVVGHEMSGRVAALGDGVDGWQVGDQVTVIPLLPCRACPACDAGHSHLCHNLVFLGIDADGAMQTSWTVPAHTLVRLPDEMPLDVAALVEPVAVAVHDVGRAEVRPGERVLVVGGGPVGLLMALVAQIEGADVRLSEPDEARRELVAAAGVATIDPAATDVAASVTEWTEGKGADVAFEVSGAAAGVATAVAALKVRGRLTLVAVHTKSREVDLFRFFWRELTLVGARLYDRSDFERAVELVQSGQLDVAQLISRIEPMQGASGAFAALEKGGVMKVLVDCQS